MFPFFGEMTLTRVILFGTKKMFTLQNVLGCLIMNKHVFPKSPPGHFPQISNTGRERIIRTRLIRSST